MLTNITSTSLYCIPLLLIYRYTCTMLPTGGGGGGGGGGGVQGGYFIHRPYKKLSSENPGLNIFRVCDLNVTRVVNIV